MSEIDVNPCLTVKDLAKQLRLSERQIRRLLSAGDLPAPVRIGRAIRFIPTVISEWMTAGCPTNKTRIALPTDVKEAEQSRRS